MFTFTAEKFSGPLDLLLSLVEGQELKITEIPLAEVTDKYLAYVNSSAEIDESEMADFLVLAAKLLFLKSKELLPQLVVEDEQTGDELQRQLKMYEQFVRAAEEIKEILLRRRFMYPRQELHVVARGFQPPKTISAYKLGQVVAEIVTRRTPQKLEQAEIKKVMSIREKIDAVQDMLKTFNRTHIKHLIDDPSSKADIIVTFLAILELAKQRSVHIEQDEQFADIHITAKV